MMVAVFKFRTTVLAPVRTPQVRVKDMPRIVCLVSGDDLDSSCFQVLSSHRTDSTNQHRMDAQIRQPLREGFALGAGSHDKARS